MVSIDPAVLRSLKATSIGSFGSTLIAVSFGLILNPPLGALFIVGGFKPRVVDLGAAVVGL